MYVSQMSKVSPDLGGISDVMLVTGQKGNEKGCFSFDCQKMFFLERTVL
jgi:hypothetical protein